MKFELTDNELQIYHTKVKIWQDKLEEHMRLIPWYLPEIEEKYGLSNYTVLKIEEFKEKHPFPKLVEL
jgi:hypothetical protein